MGGTYEPGNASTAIDEDTSTRIIARCLDRIGDLTLDVQSKGLQIVSHGVGLRPSRKGGPRVETEIIGVTFVVHNYGHSGIGYLLSYGCAQEVVQLVKSYSRPVTEI